MRPLRVVFSRLSCRLSVSFSELYIRTIFIIFEDLSGLFVIILFVLHQVAHGGIGVPFRVGLSRLDLTFTFVFLFQISSSAFLRFNMLLPASVKKLI